jgi:hypothetical protein
MKYISYRKMMEHPERKPFPTTISYQHFPPQFHTNISHHHFPPQFQTTIPHHHFPPQFQTTIRDKKSITIMEP